MVSSPLKNKFSLLFFLPLFFVLTGGCDSAPDETQSLKEQNTVLQNQIKGWQSHYRQLFCLKDALSIMDNLDVALEFNLDLATYKQKILAADVVLDAIDCPEAGKEPLLAIMSLHHLAARVWEARSQGDGAELAEDFIKRIYPLWIKYNHLDPPAMTYELREALEGYELASGPAAHNYLNVVRHALGMPESLAQLGTIADQLLWHEAHNQLVAYKIQLLTPPYPTQ